MGDGTARQEQLRGGPLRGLRVLELAGLGAAPFCAMLLADLGADVLRIERPRAAADWTDALLMRGRRSVVVDLKRPGAAELVLPLVAAADALVEGHRPGVMERLGLGPDVCLDRNPRLVYGRMTGWGQDGPYAAAPGHDLNYVAISGALAAIGPAGGPPVPPLNLVGDFGGGGLLLAFGIVSALLEARSSGRGQVVDAAMADGAALLMTMTYELRNRGLWRAERGANLLDGGAPFYDVYACADGRLVSVACLEPQFYAELLRLLELDEAELGDYRDPASWPTIRAALAAAFAARTAAECEALFAGSEVCFAPVLSVDEAPANEHNRARRTFYESGEGPLPAPAPRFGRTPAATPAAPRECTRETLREWGLDEAAIDGIVAAQPGATTNITSST